MDAKNNDNMLIYQSEDGEIKIDVRFENKTVWLSPGSNVRTFWT